MELDPSSILDYINLLLKSSFEIGPIRPPNEGGGNSLLIRVTRNCPWSQCTFCYGTPYDRKRFQLRSVYEVKVDIDTVKMITEWLSMASYELGFQGEITSRFIHVLFSYYPILKYNYSLICTANWLLSGSKTVFIQDADSLIMPTSDLVEVIRYLRKVFPSIVRVTSYARMKTLNIKSIEDLKEIRRSGLNRLHVGLESGDDLVLRSIHKGVTSSEHIEGGRKAIEAGFELSLYVMPGLGGKSRYKEHALNTAKILNEINPHYIRVRTLVPRPGTPLHNDYVNGVFKLLSPHELLEEIKILVENLNVESRLCFDHFINPSYKVDGGIKPLFRQDYEGYKLPDEKNEVLDTIRYGLTINEAKFIHVKELINLPSI
ncbi:MAG: radical SAM protein [Candidatus Methanomethylicia archaeon]